MRFSKYNVLSTKFRSGAHNQERRAFLRRVHHLWPPSARVYMCSNDICTVYSGKKYCSPRRYRWDAESWSCSVFEYMHGKVVNKHVNGTLDAARVLKNLYPQVGRTLRHCPIVRSARLQQLWSFYDASCIITVQRPPRNAFSWFPFFSVITAHPPNQTIIAYHLYTFKLFLKINKIRVRNPVYTYTGCSLSFSANVHTSVVCVWVKVGHFWRTQKKTVTVYVNELRC